MITMLKELPGKTDGYQYCKNHPFNIELKIIGEFGCVLDIVGEPLASRI
jgi:hypothetical protein